MLGRKKREVAEPVSQDAVKPETGPKALDVHASMQGSLVFKDPVNLRIQGRFEGTLDTKGSLSVGETAVVEAEITGEDITIAGKVKGNVTAARCLRIVAPGVLTGNIKTPVLVVTEGAVLNGKCVMEKARDEHPRFDLDKEILSTEEVARYLEVSDTTVEEWARTSQLPATMDADGWKFERSVVEEWLTKQR